MANIPCATSFAALNPSASDRVLYRWAFPMALIFASEKNFNGNLLPLTFRATVGGFVQALSMCQCGLRTHLIRVS